MTTQVPRLIGREAEVSAISARIDAAGRSGGIVFIAGEAGIGKTALIDRITSGLKTRILRSAAAPTIAAPFAPIVAILRANERHARGTLAASGPLAPHLWRILPELGTATAPSDRLLVIDALKDACRAVVRDAPAIAVIEDLQWADEATLDFLPELADAVADLPLLVIASYRSDEIHRGHSLRRARAELRRARRLEDLTLDPLGSDDTARVIEQIVGEKVGPNLARAVFEKTGGVPFFIEEITAALSAAKYLVASPAGLELSQLDFPIPETVRDAVRIRTDRLSDEGRAAIELAAVAGGIDLSLVMAPDEERAIDEAAVLGLLAERDGGGRFRHALIRESIYADIPWTRRRAFHRRVAEALERSGAAPEAVAEQWLGAREPERARIRLLEAADSFCAMAAYRDAARAARKALELWPEGADEEARVAALERFAHCAEVSGDLAEAARALEEIRDAVSANSDAGHLGDIARRLAGMYELQGMPERTRSAREQAAAAFEQCGRTADAIVERLAIAERLELAGGGTAAVAMLERLAGDLDRAGTPLLRIRALALEGELRAKLGQRSRALEMSRRALSLALDDGDAAATAEAYYRLGAALENSCDHEGAVQAYTTARGFCLGKNIDGLAQVCFACMLPALLLTGQWSRTIEVAESVLQSPDSPPVAQMKAKAHIAIVSVLRGHTTRARRMLEEAYAFSQQQELVPIEVFSAWGLARAADLTGSTDEASARCREVLKRAAKRDERHYSVPVLRWAATLFARRAELRELGDCIDVLSGMAEATAHPECLGPLAHAHGELALASGRAEAAVEHFSQALRLMGEAGIPYERAETQLRSGIALAAAGRRDDALAQWNEAYRTARRLGARPLAQKVADAMHAAGQPTERRVDGGGLSPREADVLRLVADGLSNRQIAACLFISKRTVDMHVRNVLSRLGCSSRIEAVGRARSLQILR